MFYLRANLQYIRRKSKLFTDVYSANRGVNPRLFGIEGLFHDADGVSLGGFGDVDVGFHGFVVGVAGELPPPLKR